MITRRRFLASTAGLLGAAALPSFLSARQEALLWHDVKEWGVEGKGWNETARRQPSDSR